MTPTSTIVAKVWNYCNMLRDDGVGYGDYLEQLTYLLFLKMADEYSKPPYDRDTGIPKKYAWPELVKRRGAELESFYIELLRELGLKKGILGQIFTKSQNKIQDPAKLYKVIQMIDSENWLIMGSDVKGDIYEGLLEKYAEDVKSGAGQYFTPRTLIKAMVECVRPEPKKTIADPACGTGGFFLACYDFLVDNHKLTQPQKEFLKKGTFAGNEIVPSARRLALMNMFPHNIGEISGGLFLPEGEPVSESITPMSINVGASFHPEFGKFAVLLDPVFHVDIRNVAFVKEYYDSFNPLELLNVGAQITVLKFLNARAGFNGGYFTGGVGVKLLFLEANVSAVVDATTFDEIANFGVSAEITLRF